MRVLAASAALGACVFAASPAAAQTCSAVVGGYPVSVDCVAGSTVNEDGSISFSFGPGTFAQGESVDVFVNGTLVGTFVAAADGSLTGRIRASVIASLGETGIASLTLVGRSSGARATVQVDLAAAAAANDTGSGGSGLVNTGSDSTIPLATSGVTLVMLGAAMVVVARRSRSSAPVAA